MATIPYSEFIKSKSRSTNATGIIIRPTELNKWLKDFQRFSVRIALKKGKFALFEDCGLGKTLQQLEWAWQVSCHTGKPVLILAPLAVTEQTISEGKKFGIEVQEVGEGRIQITNYEQLHNIDVSIYGGVVLDESSILKDYEGAYRNLIIDKFRFTAFKLACSATPSPNDPMELGNHAEFLDIMNRQEMLATYFIHDGGDTSKWRLKGHAQDTFWQWVCSWALMFSKPSDIGFSDEGYELPGLKFIERQIHTNIKEGRLFNDIAISATNFHSEVRITRLERLEQVESIVKSTDDSYIVWVEQNDDAAILKKNIAGSVEVKGSDKPTYKKQMLLGFANDAFRVLITKPKIAAYGLNYQNCHNQVFASPDYSYEKIYQAIRRSLRFGQKFAVNVYLITTDTMESVITTFKVKQLQHQQMQASMNKHTRKLYYEEYSAAA